MPTGEINSKRKILKHKAKIFDPLELVTPITVGLKFSCRACGKRIYLECNNRKGRYKHREAAHGKFTWANIDSPCVIGQLNKNFNWLIKQEVLYAFVDASKLSYAAVVHARTAEGKVTFLVPKNRLAPVK